MAPILNRRVALIGTLTTFAAMGEALAQEHTALRDRFAAAPERALTDAQWRTRLQPAAYTVLRRAGTERPFTSRLNEEHRRGVFACAGCALPLFQSQWKFDSGTGWPSFFRAMDANIIRSTDTSGGMTRTEYHCARCLGHHGHVFNDGPAPTGLRYCNNGVALSFSA